jgi:hypothetical protein
VDLPRCWCFARGLVLLADAPKAEGLSDHLHELGNMVQEVGGLVGSTDKPEELSGAQDWPCWTNHMASSSFQQAAT